MNRNPMCLFFAVCAGVLVCSAPCVSFAGERPGAAWEVSLEQITRYALENSFDVQIAKYDAFIARTKKLDAESVFDAFLNGTVSYQKDKTKPPSIFQGEKTVTNKQSLGITKKLPSGTEVTLDLDHTRTFSDAVSAVVNPVHEPVVGITIVQPVGKNFFGMNDRADVRMTLLDIANAEFTSLDDIEGAVADLHVAYWDAALAEERVRIREAHCAEAERLYGIYQEKYALGLAEKGDLIAMEAALRSRQSDLELALLERTRAQNKLLFLSNAADPSVPVKAEDPLAVTPEGVVLEEVITDAVRYRRDYRAMQNTVARKQIEVLTKDNALWPEIDLKASLVKNGLDSSAAESWQDVTGEDNASYYVGLTFRVPLENKKARAAAEKARLEKVQALLKLKRIERLILRELNDAVAGVDRAENRIELGLQVVALQRKKLLEEEERLRYGRSNADLLIRYEEDVLNAELDLAGAFADYRKARVALEKTKNTLLTPYWNEEL